jgi:hypothetical protein
MKRSWIVVVAVACSCCLVGGVATAAAEEAPPAHEATAPAGEGASPALETSCPNSGVVCVWTNVWFGGVRSETLCLGGAHPLAAMKFSAKNRCANKGAWLRINGVAFECVEPGGQHEVAEFNEVWIGKEGSHC